MTYGAETWTLATHAKNKLAAAKTKMERSMLNITCRDRKIIVWVREKTKVTDKSEDGSGPGQGTSAGYKITDGHCVSPLGNHTKGKDLEEDQRDVGETN